MNTSDTIVKVLAELGVDEWILREEAVSAREFFFIKKDLDMNRAKDVKKHVLTLYRSFEEEGKLYKGLATISLPDQVEREEIISRIEKAWFAASFVKNRPFPMAEREIVPVAKPKSRLAEEDPTALLEDLRRALYGEDTFSQGCINAAEFFLNRYEYRLRTSTGLDVAYPRYQGDLELICDWRENGEEVEIYNMFSFADGDEDLIRRECREQLENCRLRSQARPAPEIRDINIILTGEALRETTRFYLFQSSARGKFEKTARGEAGEIFQGDDARGDLLSLTLEPYLEGSPQSAPYDKDGVALKPAEIYRDGKLLRYHGSRQYSHYMDVETTGLIPNTVVKEGSRSVEEWRKEPHVETRSFTNFQMNGLPGDFGGEVRLALWFDGHKTVPLTGASLSASLFDVQKEIYFSKERMNKENYSGPAYLMYPKGHLAGE